MGIGGCIALFAVGAILTFAVNWHVHGMNIDVIGIILMAAGLVGLFAYGSLFGRRRYSRGTVEVPPDQVVEERRYYD